MEEKSVRVIYFDGTRKAWPYWSLKFLAKAREQGYAKILNGKESVPTDTEYNGYESGKNEDEKKSYEKNQKAFDALLLSMDVEKSEGRAIFNLIKVCRSDDLSDCLLYTSPSPRDGATSRMPSSA